MKDLIDLPNIGAIVAQRLKSAGVKTPQDLRWLGSVETLCRIRDLSPDDPPCRSMLCGLEGAIRGVRWHDIPQAERDALWQRYQKRTTL